MKTHLTLPEAKHFREAVSVLAPVLRRPEFKGLLFRQPGENRKARRARLGKLQRLVNRHDTEIRALVKAHTDALAQAAQEQQAETERVLTEADRALAAVEAVLADGEAVQ